MRSLARFHRQAASSASGVATAKTSNVPSFISSLATLVILAALIRRMGFGTLATAAGLVLAGTSAMFLVYGTMLDTPVLGWWRSPSPVHVVDHAESSAVFRAPVADLLDPANRGSTVIRRDGMEWRGPGFVVRHATGEHLVWGFTGMLLNGLFDRLGWTEAWDDGRELPLPFE